MSTHDILAKNKRQLNLVVGFPREFRKSGFPESSENPDRGSLAATDDGLRGASLLRSTQDSTLPYQPKLKWILIPLGYGDLHLLIVLAMGFSRKRTLTSLARITFFVATIAYILQFLLRGKQRLQESEDLATHQQQHHEIEVKDDHIPDSNATLWQLMVNDPSISEYVKLNEPFDDIKGHLDNASEIYTLYVPVDSAFKNQTYPVDAPDFYWKFLSLNHMGPEAVSYQDLLASTTVPNFINHDIYFKYLQRISTKDKDGDVVFNHVGKYVGNELSAINGYVHHISAMLHLPDAASDILRDCPDFGAFRRGLILTDVAICVNDSQGHLTQTIFAPSNKAFDDLGPKVNKFLFSPWGKQYLAALLKYHLVMNSTLFTDIYFRPKGLGQVKLNTSSEMIQLPTLLPNLNLTTNIVKNGRRQTIKINNKVVVCDPDVIVMDGVIHKIDTVLMPPSSKSSEDKDSEENAEDSWASWLRFLPWSVAPSKMTVEDLMERLQPYLEV